jgi:regulator of sigma E protease
MLLYRSITLALFGVLGIWAIRYFGFEGLLKLAEVFLGIGIVIFIHELGHFLVAKWCDVHVETFSLGFGPAIPGCSFRRGETFYKIAWIPLGGYVKMVGEGTDGDEDDDDPRSFKNKSVWQRMAIISAGVVMNVILGCLCFVFVYMTHGYEQNPADVAMIVTGGPAWQIGVPTGAVIHQIGDVTDPYFEDLKYEVMVSDKRLTLVYETPEHPGEWVRTEIQPRRDKDDWAPVIGILPVRSLKFSERPRKMAPLVMPGSPAGEAQPSFEYGDTIVGTTDPADPSRIKPLPLDPRNRETDQPDYFEFRRRLKQLAGHPMEIEVRRRGSHPDDPSVIIKVPAAFHSTLGMRMRMGQVTAIRQGSPAEQAGVRVRDSAQGIDGDVIKQVEVEEPDGTMTRYVLSRSQTPDPRVREKELDPLRLPYELSQWARRKAGPKEVNLLVLRQVDHGPKDVPIRVAWDDRWKYDEEVSLTLSSPYSIPELGLAYKIETFVEAVEKDSPAARAGIERNDLIKEIRFQDAGADLESTSQTNWFKLEHDQWAAASRGLDDRTGRAVVSLRVERGGQVFEADLSPQLDKDWPMVERGINLPLEIQLQKAGNPIEAVGLGLTRTKQTIVQIYLNLRAILTNRVSPKMIGSPILIGLAAYEIAGQSIYQLIFFFGMISVNLAVINFLPIPILDGGHMVFLIYEKLRGMPASDTAKIIAGWVGACVIVALMIFAFWNDVSKLLGL